MASSPVLDFDTLLTPIAGDRPGGEDLRLDPSPASTYYAVRDARNAARAAERQALVDGANGAAPDWRPVLKGGSKALAEKSKDLEITAYVIEALVRVSGFAGLRDGFRLARELVENFWDDLYPLPDDEGLETRLAPLLNLNGEDGEGTLIRPILRVPLTEGSSVGPFACYQIQQAVALGQIKDEAVRTKRLQEGVVPLDSIQQAVAETPRSYFAQLLPDLTACQEELARLAQTLDEKCGEHAPPTSQLRKALDACRDVLFQVAEAKLPVEGPAEDAPPAEADAPVNGAVAAAPRAAGSGAALSADAMQTRDDAFRLLLTVAEYFRRHEPQSVLSFALEQAVRWGKMGLPDLLGELVADPSSRGQFFLPVWLRGGETRPSVVAGPVGNGVQPPAEPSPEPASARQY
jgi:type VI secretion system protein ImpA